MKTRSSAIISVSAVLAAVVAVMVMTDCTQAATTSKDLSFGIKDLMVAVVPTLTAGTPMADVTLPEAKGGSGDTTYRVTPMVPGLAFDPATRVLGGTPTAAGTFPLTYTARTADGDEATLSFTVTVRSSFIGTWQSMSEWEEDGRLVGTFTDTLTFTKSRYILNRSFYRTGETSTEDTWDHGGSWEATDRTITRIWQHNHDDDDETPEQLTRVQKNYLWNEDRTVLCVEHWTDDREHLDSPQCELYRRVASRPPAELLGEWTGIWGNDNWNIVITPTQFTVSNGRIEEDGRFIGFTLTGTYEVNLEELFILVTIEDALEDGNTSVLEFDEQWRKGQVSRWAFAPTDDPDRIVVSTHWEEHEWLEQTQEWIYSTETPYGAYWLTVEKQ